MALHYWLDKAGFDAGAAGVSFHARGVVLRDQSSHRPKPVTCSTPHSGKASNANPRATMTQSDSVKREGMIERARRMLVEDWTRFAELGSLGHVALGPEVLSR